MSSSLDSSWRSVLISDSSSSGLLSFSNSDSSTNETSDRSDEESMEVDDSKVTTHGNETIDRFDEEITNKTIEGPDEDGNETAEGCDEQVAEMADLKVTTYGSADEIMEMHDANIDEIKVKLDPYPKLDDNSGENKNKYMGQEYIIVRLCHKQLYKTFPWMRGAFSEFAV